MFILFLLHNSLAAFLVAKAWPENQSLLCLNQPKNFLFYDQVAGGVTGGKLSPV